jgi:hypothetical protein
MEGIEMDVVKLVGRVVAHGPGTVKGRGADAHVVCVQMTRGYSLNGKDHVNVYPDQWDSAKIRSWVESGNLELGQLVQLVGVAKPYRRADGTKSLGLVDVELKVAVKR